MIFDKLVHYIWVGTAEIPTHFMLNYENTIKMNQDYSFKIWRESDIIPLLDTYTEIFPSCSIYHKLQLAKYMISHMVGGVYSDFDIEWRQPFDIISANFPECNLILPKRKGLYFFNRGQKTTMIDDFVIFSVPGIMKSFLDFCLVRTERKDDRSEPFSVYALTEWCLSRTDIKFITPEQIYDTPDGTFGYHYNKRTW